MRSSRGEPGEMLFVNGNLPKSLQEVVEWCKKHFSFPPGDVLVVSGRVPQTPQKEKNDSALCANVVGDPLANAGMRETKS